VGTIGDPSKIPLPVDISISADAKGLWVNTFMDGTTRYFDLTDPERPVQTYAKQTGKQVNMVSQSWDGKRVYITSSLLAKWDKKGADDEQFLRGFDWDGKELKLGVRNGFQGGEARPTPSHEIHRTPGRRRIDSRALMRLRAIAVGVAACAAALNVNGCGRCRQSRRNRAWSSRLHPRGSYALQRIQRAPDGALLNPDSRIQSLAELTSGKITLLTFFYTYCADPWGCPYAY
jgi:hypothetical protein